MENNFSQSQNTNKGKKNRTFNFSKTDKNLNKVCSDVIPKNDDNFSCIKGSFCQNSDIFDGNFRNTQCTSNAVMALCMSQLKSVTTWNTDFIDKILVQGHELHVQSISSFVERFGQPPPSSFYLAADEVLEFFSVENTNFHVEYKLDPFQGYIDESECFFTELNRFFSNELFGVLTVANLSVAVLKNENLICLFDPHSRDQNLNAVTNGVAVLLMFKSIQELVSTFKSSLDSMLKPLFSITPLKIEYESFCENETPWTVKRKSFSFKQKQILEKNKARLRLLRLNETFKAKERRTQIESRKGKNEAILHAIRKMDVKRKKILRSQKDFKNKENDSLLIRMQTRRSLAENRILEKKKDIAKKKILRTEETYKKRENEKLLTRMQTRRSLVENRILEKKKDIAKKRILRTEETYKKRENEKLLTRMQTRRSLVENRILEKKKDIAKKRILRTEETYKKRENEKLLTRMQTRRSLVENRILEKKKDIAKKRILRTEETYKKRENEKLLTRMQTRRSLVENRVLEKKKDIAKKRILRTKETYKKKENARLLTRMQTRRSIPGLKQKEKALNSKQRKEKREHHLYKFREQYYNTLQKKNSLDCQAKLRFIKERSMCPEHICCFCEGLFFAHSVVKYQTNYSKKYFGKEFVESIDKLRSNLSPWTCKTCYRYVQKGVIPKLATTNGLKFIPIPNCIQILSPLEERMVAPFINFMQIRDLKPFALNPQLGMKGSVVNISVEVNDMLQVLPRRFDNMKTIQLKLRRHLDHATNYMFETIRPAVVCDALKYLMTTPLYIKNNIQIDKAYFNQYDKEYDELVEFIVDSNDAQNPQGSLDRFSQGDSMLEEINLDEFKGLPKAKPSTSNKGKRFEEYQVLQQEIHDEVLVIDRNKEAADCIPIIAPGQGKTPVPWHLYPNLEELCFPKIYCGHPLESSNKISYSERAKSIARRNDRRGCVPTKILYMAKKKLEQSCLSNINICLRKSKRTNQVTADNILKKNFVDSLIQHDAGYRILNRIPSSPSYWELKKMQLMAMIRQLGKPTLFLTLSAAESNWPELIQLLSKLLNNQTLSIEEAMSLENCEKTELIRNDPVTCARYFDHKVAKFMKYIKSKNGPFNEFEVLDSYQRVEFQMRGSPHEHMFLWLKNAPVYKLNDEESKSRCTSFIDRFITCEDNPISPYIPYLRHRHSHTCNKGKLNKTKCRFNFPIPVMLETQILEPLPETPVGKEKEELSAILGKIRTQMQHYFEKPSLVPFGEILHSLKITESQYINAIRNSLKNPQVFLKRNSLEVAINSYNKDVLNLFESNIDVQFVLEEYGIANYIVNYISKVDAGLSKLLRDAASDINQGHKNIKDKFRNIANVFLNSNLMSAQEAAYHVLSLPLSKSSRGHVFINTSPIESRLMMLKSNKFLQNLNSDSTDIFVENDFKKYSKRPVKHEELCLADFVANFTHSRRQNDEENENEDNYHLRHNSKIIRYRRYKLAQDPHNYYREQILLFMPWRNEAEEIENIDSKEAYLRNRTLVEANRLKYAIVEDDILDEALEEIRQGNERHECTPSDFLPEPEQIDILEQGGVENKKENLVNRFVSPPKISQERMILLLNKLNKDQREFVMHVYNCFKTKNCLPLNIFLSGSAGVGKSTVINSIFQLITKYFDNRPGAIGDSIKVLLTAPSGKAAFLINGVTLHTAFALPVSQYGGTMPNLSSDIANTIRQKLINLKLLIIDEISMVGSRLLSRVDTRLRQVMGRNEPFGGISIILVGDLNQLPPVFDTFIFKAPQNNDLNVFAETNTLWALFKIFELTKIMRQQNETLFINALNNLATGTMTSEDIQLVKSREVDSTSIPEDVIRLYSTNNDVDEYNSLKLSKAPGEEISATSIDSVLGKVGEAIKKRALEALQKKKLSDLGGLSNIVRLKKNIKYMITTNIDVEDGLVNGACGELKHISMKPNTSEVDKIWILFPPNPQVGLKARQSLNKFIELNDIDRNLVPIERKVHSINVNTVNTYQILRKQFPIVPAEAITIHKSQGQTYDKVCIDLRKSKKIRRSMMYGRMV
ncbi:uncharacterized protein LOC129919626 isoform X2 [Episyrphus balteatus]|uniref:uncharacterized protein LOC129919626 isoform X2 n=1 Tax=Episyrphus balteatus TaxID=286459 RepID=UPI00248579FE|nr:uncharacterized protein LOC129919626 isoform X2 [Episyrphus balteatus]